jgi:hypothetical protein
MYLQAYDQLRFCTGLHDGELTSGYRCEKGIKHRKFGCQRRNNRYVSWMEAVHYIGAPRLVQSELLGDKAARQEESQAIASRLKENTNPFIVMGCDKFLSPPYICVAVAWALWPGSGSTLQAYLEASLSS